MRQQWRRYRRLIGIGTIGLWIVCSSGILLLDDEDFIVRMALLAMFVPCTPLSLYLYLVTRKETRNLDQEAARLRLKEQTETHTKSGPIR